ncbi:MAG: tetratricopeptide repeat protein [Acidobacteria bacterium]|nr:tetratricopeptide repeat protein [Acidobacteriota bacterium]
MCGMLCSLMGRRRRRAAPPATPAPPTGKPPGAPPPPRPRLPVGARIALVLAVVLAAAALAWRFGLPPRPSPPRAGGPNVLLVTVDTLRADHLGCYGYAGARTPVIDALAARGARFETAIAHAPITGPSHASILTGLTPLRHGVRNNADYALPASVPTLPDAFRQAGYRTAAFVSGFPLERRFGYDRGFEAYDDAFPRGTDPRRAPYVERPADMTTRAVLRWLDEHQASPEPWFLWVHYYDPHSPYEPPAEYARAFAGRPYDGEIAFVDAQLGLLLRRLDERGLAARTLIVVTSDHGESLGEHGEATHGMFVYDATLRVPWVMAGPGIPGGRTATVMARGIDVAPTILEYAGRPAAAAIEGRSVRPAIEGRAMGDEPAYAESLFASLHLHWAPLYAWRTSRWKLVDAPRPELFDMAADPGEQHDRAGDEPSRVEALRRPLRAALSAPAPDAVATIDAEAASRLRSLGYLGGGPFNPRTASSKRDPKDALPLIAHLERGMELARTDPATSVTELTAVLKEAPEAVLARRYRAVAFGVLGRPDEAVADMRAIGQAGPMTAEDLVVLADSLRLAGRVDEALAALDEASALQPRLVPAWLARGDVLVNANRTEEAARAFEQVLAISPEHSEALRGLGDLALVRGDVQAAGGYYGRVLAASPGDVPAMVKLGVVRMRGGQREEAVALFRRAIELDPRNGEALLYAAGAMVATGRAADAIPYFDRAIAAGQRNPMALNGLGMTKLQLGDEAGAAAALRASLALDPNQPQVAETLRKLRR